MNNPYLFLFTIGPVQSFIAQARKTRDLYAGSQVLGELVKAAVSKFCIEFPNGSIIFPTNNEQSTTLPNRFIGKVAEDKSVLRQKAIDIQQAVENEWQSIAEDALRKAVDKSPSEIPGFVDQVKSFLDIHWVFAEVKNVDNDPEAYAKAFMEIQAMSAAVKNIRAFDQFKEAGRKCIIDGTYNALFCAKGSKLCKKYHLIPVPGFYLSSGEGLSAVSLTKRFFQLDDDKFPSTAEVALINDIKKLSPDNKTRLDCFTKLFKIENIVESCIKMATSGLVEKIQLDLEQKDDWNDQFDFQMLFEENLIEQNLPNDSQRKLLKNLFAKLKPDLKTRYYAVIRFDGDHMGKWMSGEFNKTKEDLESFHTTLSDALAKFGEYAKDHLNEKEKGHTVYAGGDDFLGFVNIHCLFDVMKELRKQFDEMVNKRIDSFKKPDCDLTFSAGIVVAHYKTPFSEVLNKARSVEKAAKQVGDRNAFGIAVMKHSGEMQQAVYKWGDENSPSSCSNWEALEKVYLELDQNDGNFSNTFIQNLTAEIRGLAGVNMENFSAEGYGSTVNDKVMPKEIERLVDRSWKETRKKDNAKVKKLSEDVIQLWQNTPKDSGHRPRNFIHVLHVADFLNRKITQER